MKVKLNDLLACPKCKSELRSGKNTFFCRHCNEYYSFVARIPNFLLGFDKNKKHQEGIWDNKAFQNNPKTMVFTTIQERFGNRLLRNIKLPRGSVAVDAGCFFGEKLWQLKDNEDYLGIGVDISLPSLKIAKKVNSYNHQFIAADLENLPFKNSSIDFVMVFDVIEHLTNPNQGFFEISRVLKPGGLFILHVPIKDNKYSFFWWKQKFFPKAAKKDYLDVGHFKEKMLTTSQIKEFLEKHSLHLEKEIYYNSFLVHFFDRELIKILGVAYTKLRRQKSSAKTSLTSKQKGSVSIFHKVYGKALVPFFEILSFPDVLLSKLGIGNTYFVVAKKNENRC